MARDELRRETALPDDEFKRQLDALLFDNVVNEFYENTSWGGTQGGGVATYYALSLRGISLHGRGP